MVPFWVSYWTEEMLLIGNGYSVCKTLCEFHGELAFYFSADFGRLSRLMLVNTIHTYTKTHIFIKNPFYINTKLKFAFLELLKEKGM